MFANVFRSPSLTLFCNQRLLSKMKFQTKILLVTLSILVLTLLINSLLSLASFEKIYVKSQISTYELICKDIKRKIERSLRFGKPLEQFKNMDRLLEETLEQNPKLSNIAITDLKGQVLYHTNTVKIGSNIGNRFPPIDDIKIGKTSLIDQFYHSFLSLHGRSKKPVGIVELTFSRNIIFEKLKNMAFNNLNILWVLMLLTSILLIFLLAMVIMRPINVQVLKISNILKWKEIPFENGREKTALNQTRAMHHEYLKEDSPPSLDTKVIENYLQFNAVNNEIDRLGVNIETFANSTTNLLNKLDTIYLHKSQFVDACKELEASHAEIEKQIETGLIDVLPEEKQFLAQSIESLQRLILYLQTADHFTGVQINLEEGPTNI